MPTNVNDIIGKLSSTQRKNVEARAAELIAEEMTLRELRQARKLTQVRIATKLGITQDSVSRLEKPERPLAVHAPEDRRGDGGAAVTGRRISRPCPGCSVRHCRRRSGAESRSTRRITDRYVNNRSAMLHGIASQIGTAMRFPNARAPKNPSGPDRSKTVPLSL